MYIANTHTHDGWMDGWMYGWMSYLWVVAFIIEDVENDGGFVVCMCVYIYIYIYPHVGR